MFVLKGLHRRTEVLVFRPHLPRIITFILVFPLETPGFQCLDFHLHIWLEFPYNLASFLVLLQGCYCFRGDFLAQSILYVLVVFPVFLQALNEDNGWVFFCAQRIEHGQEKVVEGSSIFNCNLFVDLLDNVVSVLVVYELLKMDNVELKEAFPHKPSFWTISNNATQDLLQHANAFLVLCQLCVSPPQSLKSLAYFLMWKQFYQLPHKVTPKIVEWQLQQVLLQYLKKGCNFFFPHDIQEFLEGESSFLGAHQITNWVLHNTNNPWSLLVIRMGE